MMAEQIITAVLSSAGLTGSIFAAIVTAAIRHAGKNAENKRNERMKLEILRLEGEEKIKCPFICFDTLFKRTWQRK